MNASRITSALQLVTLGGVDARDELFEALRNELRGIAAAHLARERNGHTLQPTALVNEAWLRLDGQSAVPEGGRVHFLSVASQAMRRILVDHARGRQRDKRGGGAGREDLDRMTLQAEMGAMDELDLLALDEALGELQRRSERQARLIELRFFGGLTAQETAEALGVSLATVDREWRFARLWLLSRLA